MENSSNDQIKSIIDSQKTLMLQRLNYIKVQSELIIDEITIKSKEYQRTIKHSAKLAIKDLAFIITQVNSLTEQINSFSIIRKKFLNPLEKFLFTIEKSDLMDNLIGPKAIFPLSDFKFKLSLPTFIHELTTYSSLAISFKEENLLSFPKLPQIHNKLFNSSSRCLQVDSNQILVSGYSENHSCILVNFSKKRIKSVESLIKPRRWHAMTWLNGFPCVIGGKIDNVDSNSVEILKNYTWYEERGMNIARSSFSAVSYLDKVWAVGGINNETMCNVEVFQNGNWELLNICNELLCSSIGLVGVGPYLMILGGFKMNSKSKVSLFNVVDESLTEVFEFNDQVYFNQNSIAIFPDSFKAFDSYFSLQELHKSKLYP